VSNHCREFEVPFLHSYTVETNLFKLRRCCSKHVGIHWCNGVRWSVRLPELARIGITAKGDPHGPIVIVQRHSDGKMDALLVKSARVSRSQYVAMPITYKKHPKIFIL